jgi:hypothetical protein
MDKPREGCAPFPAILVITPGFIGRENTPGRCKLYPQHHLIMMPSLITTSIQAVAIAPFTSATELVLMPVQPAAGAAMLAYLFWHRPYSTTSVKQYEETLLPPKNSSRVLPMLFSKRLARSGRIKRIEVFIA